MTTATPRRAVLAALVSAALAALGATAGAAEDDRSRASRLLAQQPLHFEANLGQTDSRVRFLSRGNRYSIFLTDAEAVLTLSKGGKAADVVRLRFVGALPAPDVKGTAPLTGRSHYFLGSDPEKWQRDVPHFGRVEYRDLYPGVGLAFYGTAQRQLEYDLLLEPGADLGPVRLRIEGARSLRLDDAGQLLIETKGGTLVQKAPVVYELDGGERRLLPGRYTLSGRHEVGFEVEGRDPAHPLVVDPILTWSAYLGGNSNDEAHGVAVDTTGVYVSGETRSPNFPDIAGFGTYNNNLDAFITKIDLAGSTILFTAFVGGPLDDIALAVAVGAGGDVFITGATTSAAGFTLFSAQQPTYGGGSTDAFVTCLQSTGANLCYSTYLGGSGTDFGNAIAVLSTRTAFVTGTTSATGGAPFPTLPLDTYKGGTFDAFVARYHAAAFLEYSRFLGGTGEDRGNGIAVNAAGEAHVVGSTSSALTFPRISPVQGTHGGGFNDAFLTKIGALSGVPIGFSTFLGGSGDDQAHAISLATGAPGGIYVAGETQSPNFPRVNPLPSPLGSIDAFVTKYTTAGTSLVYSTPLGGSLLDRAKGISADTSGFAYITGTTQSATNFPIVDPIVEQTAYGGGANDAFVARLVPTGCAVSYSTYLGGSGSDVAGGIAALAPGSVYVAGTASNTAPNPFPVKSSFDLTYNGGPTDAFVAQLTDSPPSTADILVQKSGPATVNAGSPLSYTIQVTNLGPGQVYGATIQDVLPTDVVFVSSLPGPGPNPPSCSHSAGVVTCNLGCMGVGATIPVVINTVVNGDTASPISNMVTRVASSPTDPNPFNDQDSVVTTVIQNADLALQKTDSPDPVALGQVVTYSLTVTNNGPSTATGVQVVDTLPAGTTFLSFSPASASCVEGPPRTITCTPGAPLVPVPPLGSFVITIQAVVDATGTLVNSATVSGTPVDLVPGNNSAQASSTVTVPPTALPVLAATSTGGPGANTGLNVLQWRNPSGGPFFDILFRYNKAPFGSDVCTFPTSTGGFSTGVFTLGGSPVGAKQSLPHGSLELDTAYCYTVWVEIVPGTFSVPRTVKARPFDSTSATVPVRWAYSTGGTSVVPPGLGSSGVITVSHDRVLHSMNRGGPFPGEWPGPWLPPTFNGPAQSRPPVVPTTVVAGSNNVVFVGTEDGLVQAVDADTGLPRWTSAPLGGIVTAAPAGMFTTFTGSVDQVFVGTRTAGDNVFYALDAATGALVGAGFDNGGGSSGIGIISAGAAVDYANDRVYFTSRRKAAGSNNTLWCLNITAGGLTPNWARALDDIDAAPVLHGGRVYVGTLTNRVISVPADGVGLDYEFPTGAGEVAKLFVFPDRDSNRLYVATNNKVWGFTDTGSALTQTWPEVDLPGAATTSGMLFVRGTPYFYVGASTGDLYEFDLTFAGTTTPPTFTTVLLGPGASVVGAPSIDTSSVPNRVFVGTEAGVIYAVDVPLP